MSQLIQFGYHFCGKQGHKHFRCGFHSAETPGWLSKPKMNSNVLKNNHKGPKTAWVSKKKQYFYFAETPQKDKCYFDSACLNHMTGNKKSLQISSRL